MVIKKKTLYSVLDVSGGGLVCSLLAVKEVLIKIRNSDSQEENLEMYHEILIARYVTVNANLFFSLSLTFFFKHPEC